MNKKEAENICLKYLNNQASNAEIEQLLSWIETPENLKLFNDYIAINYYLNYKYKKADTAKAYKKALFMQDKKRKKNTFFTYIMAASIALLISVTLFYNKNKNGLDLTTKKPIIVNNTIKPGADKAVLTLEDGVSISLEKGIKYKNATVNSNGEELIYNNTSKINKLAYSYLTISRGGSLA